MNTQLSFNQKEFTPVVKNNQTWLSATELASALDYKSADSVTKIYNRNIDEFSEGMSLTAKLTVKGFGSGNSEKDVRIFSLRGAHLIAMFSRTKVAKDFRKWVLDIIDQEIGNLATAQLAPTTITPDQQNVLQNRVRDIVNATDMAYPAVWGRFNNKFKLGSYKQLPIERFNDACAYLDGLNAKPKLLPPPLKLPEAVGIDTAHDMASALCAYLDSQKVENAEEVKAGIRAIYRWGVGQWSMIDHIAHAAVSKRKCSEWVHGR